MIQNVSEIILDIKDDDKRVQIKEDNYYITQDNTLQSGISETLLDKIVKWFRGIIEKIKYVIKNK